MKNFNQFLAEEWPSLAQCCALIERMLPNYVLFSQVCDFGDPKVLRSCLDVLWACCAASDQRVDFEKQLLKLEEVSPELNDFDTYGVRPASDACTALNTLLDCLAGNQPFDPEVFQALYHSTIASYLEAIGDEQMDNKHALVCDAEDFMAELNGIAVQQSVDRRACVKAMRSFAQSIETSNIGIAKE